MSKDHGNCYLGWVLVSPNKYPIEDQIRLAAAQYQARSDGHFPDLIWLNPIFEDHGTLAAALGIDVIFKKGCPPNQAYIGSYYKGGIIY